MTVPTLADWSFGATIPAKDLDGTRRFYEEVLGAHVVNEDLVRPRGTVGAVVEVDDEVWVDGHRAVIEPSSPMSTLTRVQDAVT